MNKLASLQYNYPMDDGGTALENFKLSIVFTVIASPHFISGVSHLKGLSNNGPSIHRNFGKIGWFTYS